MDNEFKLKKYLSIFEVFSLAFGCSIGWGVFIMPGTSFLPYGGIMGTIIGLIIGAILMIIIGRNYHIMMNRTNGSGGAFTYAKDTFGNDHGFLCAWFLLLTYFALIWANSTALVLLARNSFGDLFQFGFHYTLFGYDIYFGEAITSALISCFLCFICLLNKKFAVMIQSVSSTILIIGIVISFIFSLTNNTNALEKLSPLFLEDKNYMLQIFEIIVLVPWAFVGFESISHSKEEFKFKSNKSFMILLISIILITLSYIALLIVSVVGIDTPYLDFIAGYKGMLSTNPITFYAMKETFGQSGIIVIGITMICALITSIIGNTVATSRLIYSMSEEGLVPKIFSRVNKNGAPYSAILLIMAITFVIPFLGRTAIGWHVDISTVGATIAFAYTSLCVFKISKKEHDKSKMIFGLLGFIISVIFSVLLLTLNVFLFKTFENESYFILAIWAILGLIYFRYLLNKNKMNKYGKTSIVWVSLLALIFITLTFWTSQTISETYNKINDEIIELYQNEDTLRLTMTNDEWLIYEEKFLSDKSSEFKFVILTYTLAELLLAVSALVLMFNIYNKASKNETQAQLEKIKAEERDKAKSSFLFNMSHDIRTPMNSIIGFVDIAKKKDATKEELLYYIDKIGISSEYLLSLIDDILEMSRIENKKLEISHDVVDLYTVFENTNSLFDVLMKNKNIEFILDYKTIKHRYVKSDLKALNRILFNLISNALKFSNEGGKVLVTLKENNSNYILSVKDYGIGIGEEFKDKIYNAFERENTDGERTGTGLGMAITKNLIDLMGGKIEVESKLNEGTEFIVYLNLEEAEKPDVDKKSDIEDVDLKGKNVLLVEDVLINKEIAVLMLDNIGCNTDTAQNGEEACEMFFKNPEKYDIILMDIQMPILNGYEATKTIRNSDNEYAKAIPIVAITANAFEEDVKKALSSGMNDHLAKPINLDNLINVLKKNIKR